MGLAGGRCVTWRIGAAHFAISESPFFQQKTGQNDEAQSVQERQIGHSLEHTSGGEDASMIHGPYEPQHSASDGEDDVQRGTREAVEHMLSTEDAAGEILDDSAPSSFSSSAEASGSLQNRASLLPGVSRNADPTASGRRLEPVSNAEALTFDPTHDDLQQEEASSLERTRTVRAQEPLVERADTDRSGIQRYETPFTDHGSSEPQESSRLRTVRPPSFFPGPHSFLPGSKRVAKDVLPRSADPPKSLPPPAHRCQLYGRALLYRQLQQIRRATKILPPEPWPHEGGNAMRWKVQKCT
ncbi:uncharacterized protein LTR77_002403 [Saxophila tyrrhenica]|uniref:Uncharacterized protein n=1 Tax=Saxophila tyrrhenica TaxID=1690608 RepID=A0AAV9PIE6_9PEZI|nr:hypothetical protein LTR77_002403 [Saxophila tyrrhenica]